MGFGKAPKIDLRLSASKKKRENISKSKKKQDQLKSIPLTPKTRRHINRRGF